MSKFKVKRLTAHILMLKVINDMLKYSFHLTLTQVKLLNLLVKYDNSDSNSASIDRLLKMKEIQSEDGTSSNVKLFKQSSMAIESKRSKGST